MSSLAAFRAWHGSLAAYARLFLPTLLSEVDWCLYVDGDTLFTDDPAKVLACRAEDVAIVGHTPFGRRWGRMEEFRDLFIPRKTRRWLLSRRLWTARWHGE